MRLCQHYKGNWYLALGSVGDARNRVQDPTGQVVVYFSLAKRKLWARPWSEFHEVVEWPGGFLSPRFVDVPWGFLVKALTQAARGAEAK